MIRVYVDMVGDLFHVGHLNMFKQAKAHGDYLIVGVHSDKTAESYKRKPIIKQEHRYQMVSNCELVDLVIEDAPLKITRDFILNNEIDYIIHGDDLSVESAEMMYSIPMQLGIMKTTSYTKGISTSEIIHKIKQS